MRFGPALAFFNLRGEGIVPPRSASIRTIMKKSSKTAPPPASAASIKPASASASKQAAGPASVTGKPASTVSNRTGSFVSSIAPPPQAGQAASAKAAPTTATVINAKVDIGFGNSLYLRGEGGSDISWEKGVPLSNTSSDEWTISLREVRRPIQFKLLINDRQWSAGEDYTVAPGSSVTLTPSF
ncbi:MAG: hypothetical protein ACREFX_10810 [Opitutaceae bacterium]